MPRALYLDGTGRGVRKKLLAMPQALPSHHTATVALIWLPTSCFWTCAGVCRRWDSRQRHNYSVSAKNEHATSTEANLFFIDSVEFLSANRHLEDTLRFITDELWAFAPEFNSVFPNQHNDMTPVRTPSGPDLS
ncbi:hypothetical protein B0H14DRAFT_3133941 [Mycena olivaceomarginata]|nr:hypothetical protein B0H14DRAFT_3133941 [Mycena olivaceomarginata]